MTAPSMQRRQILLAISQLLTASALVACGDNTEHAQVAATTAQTIEGDTELLAGIAYELFPFPTLNAQLYVQVAERLQQANNPALSTGLQQVRSALGAQSWKDLDESKRAEIMTPLQGSAFFAAARAATVEVLYRSPELFSLIGYGGSAIEHGGYINRGFDKIDWLPATKQQ
jgi:hypothetical protein